jgi:S-formylglutathione hydrolase FrmB
MMETFVASDLVDYVDRHYRTIADSTHRAIGGLSMGAFGAMNIAVHHPNIFGNVISLGGYYQAEGTIWGKDETYRQQNSPVNSILHHRSAWQLQMFLGAATQDQPYYTYTHQFAKVLENLHIRYQLDVEEGHHSWHVWQKQMYNALIWLSWK